MGCLNNTFEGVCSCFDEGYEVGGCDEEGHCLVGSDEDPGYTCGDYASDYVCSNCGVDLNCFECECEE